MKQVYGIWFPEDDIHFENGFIHENGDYQRDTFQAAMEHVKEPKIFYDIGAHVGLWSMMAIRAGFKEIHAYEPNPKTFTCLKKNLNNKDGKYNAYLYKQGVSTINGYTSIVEECVGNSGAIKLQYGVVSENQTRVSFIQYHGAASINSHECLIKIDTEGTEADCVSGMREILYALRPVVCVEQRANKYALAILQKMGMQIVNQIRKDYILTWKDQ